MSQECDALSKKKAVMSRRLARRRSRIVALAVLTLVAATYMSGAPAKSAVPSLREEADASGILIGSGSINPDYIDEPAFARTLAKHFKSLSPENELKWSSVEPQRGVFNLAPIDKLVSFAKRHHMVVKGHGFVSSGFNPEWLTQITDPAELRAVTFNHFNTIMDRYPKLMDRWDVVTEALSTFGGTGLTQNYWHQTLGADYIHELFHLAHAADPKAKLFINESLVEIYPVKRQELYALVADMVANGVPIHGVGLESHQTTTGPPPGVITEIVNEYKALGLEVAITEMDAHVHDNVTQAQIYGDFIAEALAAGVTDISFWGFTDKYTWTWMPASRPHIFDENYDPKPAFFATLNAVASHPCWLAEQRSCWSSTSVANAVVSAQDPAEPVDPASIRPPDNL
jgi:endo-1,4-beta-xylanase